jgi:hypothetical protein
MTRAEQAWKEAIEVASTFKKLDSESVKRIAEHLGLEYLDGSPAARRRACFRRR